MADTIKGTLIFAKRKQGMPQGYQVQFTSKKGKLISPPVPLAAVCFLEADAQDQMTVDIELKNGLPDRVTIPGKQEVAAQTHSTPSFMKQKQGGYHGGQSKSHHSAEPALDDATAPYNFVPYDSSSVLTGFSAPGAESETWSGSLELRIEALSPLLVGDSQQDSGNADGPAQRHFFNLGGQETIPGSSLKGMVRSLLEILSFSRMAPVNSSPLFQRDIRDRNNYMTRFVREHGGNPKKIESLVKTGYLYSEGASHYIRPCRMARVEASALESIKNKDFLKQDYKTKARNWGADRRVCFDLGNDSFHTHQKGNIQLQYRKVSKIHSAGKHQGEILFTGWMSRKHMEYVYYDEQQAKLDVPHDCFALFESQLTEPQKEKKR